MRNLVLASVLLFLLGGCSATDQPCYTQIPLEAVPQEVLQKVKTGFPAAALDRAEEVTAQTGPGYRVFFHESQRYYWLEFGDRHIK